MSGLVTLGGYDIIDIAQQRLPQTAAVSHADRYQHLFQTERGRAVLAGSRTDLCRLLWQQWSPNWAFEEDLFGRTAASTFDNPDFVDVVIHHYRHALAQRGRRADLPGAGTSAGCPTGHLRAHGHPRWGE